MHELGIARGILDAARRQCQAHGARRVTLLRLRLGALHAIPPRALQESFARVSADGPAAGARLEIESVPLVLRCRGCGRSDPAAAPACPQCGATERELVSGDELDLVEIELEEA